MDDTRARRVARIQGLYYVVTGAWPLVHMRSFEAVTGPKAERWLVQTVGGLLTAIGLVQLAGARRSAREVALLGALSGMTLAAVDIAYVARGRLGAPYAADAVLQVAAVGALARATG